MLLALLLGNWTLMMSYRYMLNMLHFVVVERAESTWNPNLKIAPLSKSLQKENKENKAMSKTSTDAVDSPPTVLLPSSLQNSYSYEQALECIGACKHHEQALECIGACKHHEQALECSHRRMQTS